MKGVRTGSPCASPGVQHPDCKLTTQQTDHELHLFNHNEDRVQNEEGNAADTSLMESDVISLQNLSTIEEEPSVLYEDSHVKQTLSDSKESPSASQATTGSHENSIKIQYVVRFG